MYYNKQQGQARWVQQGSGFSRCAGECQGAAQEGIADRDTQREKDVKGGNKG